MLEELYQEWLAHYGLEDTCMAVELFVEYITDMTIVVTEEEMRMAA